MNKEEAIANLEYLISEDCTDTQYDYVEEIKLAIDALEKQNAVKPMKYIDENGIKQVGCPYCGGVVQGDSWTFNYCPDCGRKLDWGAWREQIWQ